MKLKQLYWRKNRVSDKSQWQCPSNRVSDTKVPTGTDRAFYQAREPIEDDEESFVIRQCDMPQPAPERVTNPRTPEDRAVQDFSIELGKRAPCHLRRRLHKSMV